jgi:hypothetical protein
MPPRIRLTSHPLSSPCVVRCFHTSGPKSGPRSLFPTKIPSKYNLENRRSPALDPTDHFQWSTLKRSNLPRTPAYLLPPDINLEQNALTQIRIDNPVDIDPKETPDSEKEANLLRWNRIYGGPSKTTGIALFCFGWEANG